jgi:phage shock protein PspC (stress-responsive transcriptional regulator)
MEATVPSPSPQDASLAGARAWFREQGLARPREHRVIGGVTAAFARRFGMNRLVARILMFIGVVTLTPLVYIGLWVLMPSE